MWGRPATFLRRERNWFCLGPVPPPVGWVAEPPRQWPFSRPLPAGPQAFVFPGVCSPLRSRTKETCFSPVCFRDSASMWGAFERRLSGGGQRPRPLVPPPPSGPSRIHPHPNPVWGPRPAPVSNYCHARLQYAAPSSKPPSGSLPAAVPALGPPKEGAFPPIVFTLVFKPSLCPEVLSPLSCVSAPSPSPPSPFPPLV